ncbi:MAG: hypothetical protein GX856_02345, partial [Gammaproteobacteria bacterium]|nr:hypothetical protein [Gammaproteobacteria bacterium]
LLVQALRPGSEMRRILLRVAIAALLAGGLASLLDLERAYWAVAAAVLLLFQGFDWVRMLARSTDACSARGWACCSVAPSSPGTRRGWPWCWS